MDEPMKPGFYEVRKAGAGVCIRRMEEHESPPALLRQIDVWRENAPQPGVYWVEPASGGQSMYRLDVEATDLPRIHELAWKASVLTRCTGAARLAIEAGGGTYPSALEVTHAVLDELIAFAREERRED